MKRQLFSANSTAAINAATKASLRQFAFYVHLSDSAGHLKNQDIKRVACLGGPNAWLKVTAKTAGINLAVLTVINFDTASPQITAPEKLRIDASFLAMLIPSHSEAINVIKPLTLFDRQQRLKRCRPRFKMLSTRPLATSCAHGIRADVAGDRTNVCHLPCSHELQGNPSVSSIAFGLNWPVFLARDQRSPRASYVVSTQATNSSKESNP